MNVLGVHNSSVRAKPVQLNRAAVNSTIHIVFFTWLLATAAVAWLLK